MTSKPAKPLPFQALEIKTAWGSINLTLDGEKVVGCALPLLKNTPRKPFHSDFSNPWKNEANFFQCLESNCVAAQSSALPVLFSGGVFQNRLLVEGIKKHPFFDESRMFFSSYPNDSAIALGQAAFGLSFL